MASIGAYQYLSDGGVIYQIALPSDFATAFNYVPAQGTEPYLPAYISPRFATYQTLNKLLWANVQITTPFNLTVPPQSVFFDGNQYFLGSTNGEQRNTTISANIVTVQGPPGNSNILLNNQLAGNISGGPKLAYGLTSAQATTLLNPFTSLLQGVVPASGGGTSNFLRADGSFAAPNTYTSAILNTPVLINSLATDFILQGVTPTAGLWLCLARLNFIEGPTGAQVHQARIKVGSTDYGIQNFATSQGANAYLSLDLLAVISLNGSQRVDLAGQSATYTDAYLWNQNSYLTCVKIG